MSKGFANNNKTLSSSRKYLFIALGNLFIAASIGALLRLAFVVEIPAINYKHLLHAHSHVAMLGWIFLGLFIFFFNNFLPDSIREKRSYSLLFWLTEISVIGMLISFSLQGYAAISISFSTLHVILSYVFAFQILKNTRKQAKTQSLVLARTAIIFMLTSSLGLWAMGPIMVQGLKGSSFYYLAVQWYLHFQFNGWFIFGALALLFGYFEKNQIHISPILFNRFYICLITSCILSYTLYFAWANPLPVYFVLNSLGVVIQAISLIYLIKIGLAIKGRLRDLFSGKNSLLIKAFTLSYILKVFFQTLLVVPYIATIAYTIRNYTIGFFHLLLLGIISCFLLDFGERSSLLNMEKKIDRIGIKTFVLGLLLSELILFLQGSLIWMGSGFMPYYYEFLFAISLLLPIGIGLIILGQLRSKTSGKHFPPQSL